MGKFLQRYGILFFFCAMMGGIIMVDSIFAIAFTDKEQGIGRIFRLYNENFDSAGRFTGSISAKRVPFIFAGKAQIETINVLKQIVKMEDCFIQMSLNQCKATHLEQAPDTAVTGVYYLDGGQNLIFQNTKSNFNKKINMRRLLC